MNKLITKARAGVTLVELLVVILIVTILSVSMLPLLQPFVVESQYAAEAIPVIGNIRTKIGIYQYDKGYLPTSSNDTWVLTWKQGAKLSNGTVTTVSDTEIYGPAYYVISGAAGQQTQVSPDPARHIGMQIDVDYQDLKGKRSKPKHYQYYVLSAEKNPSYVIACFGDGDGLKVGTGYAVCEMNFKNKKYIGTWKRYKSVDDDAGQLQFATTQVDAGDKVAYCYVPDAATYQPSQYDNDVVPQVIKDMEDAGWEF